MTFSLPRDGPYAAIPTTTADRIRQNVSCAPQYPEIEFRQRQKRSLGGQHEDTRAGRDGGGRAAADGRGSRGANIDQVASSGGQPEPGENLGGSRTRLRGQKSRRQYGDAVPRERGLQV